VQAPADAAERQVRIQILRGADLPMRHCERAVAIVGAANPQYRDGSAREVAQLVSACRQFADADLEIERYIGGDRILRPNGAGGDESRCGQKHYAMQIGFHCVSSSCFPFLYFGTRWILQLPCQTGERQKCLRMCVALIRRDAP
jgi:hypothetical protein